MLSRLYTCKSSEHCLALDKVASDRYPLSLAVGSTLWDGPRYLWFICQVCSPPTVEQPGEENYQPQKEQHRPPPHSYSRLIKSSSLGRGADLSHHTESLVVSLSTPIGLCGTPTLWCHSMVPCPMSPQLHHHSKYFNHQHRRASKETWNHSQPAGLQLGQSVNDEELCESITSSLLNYIIIKPTFEKGPIDASGQTTETNSAPACLAKNNRLLSPYLPSFLCLVSLRISKNHLTFTNIHWFHFSVLVIIMRPDKKPFLSDAYFMPNYARPRYRKLS